jgi:hypothetical protein
MATSAGAICQPGGITSGFPVIRPESAPLRLPRLNAMLLALDPEAEDIAEEHASAQDVCERL